MSFDWDDKILPLVLFVGPICAAGRVILPVLKSGPLDDKIRKKAKAANDIEYFEIIARFNQGMRKGFVNRSRVTPSLLEVKLAHVRSKPNVYGQELIEEFTDLATKISARSQAISIFSIRWAIVWLVLTLGFHALSWEWAAK